jgi:DNA repair exonuclease SbcCD ATPase subunit
MNDQHISIPPTAADAYRAMLAEQTYASLEEVALEVLSEGKYIISTDNLKKSFKALSTAQNGLDVAIKEYNSIEGPSGHGSGHYQCAMNIEYYRKKIKEHISAMIEIQEGLMESGEMTKLLQRAFIDELEDNVESLQKQIESRDDNNYVLKTQLRERKAVLAKAKADLKTLKESYCDEENQFNEAPSLIEGKILNEEKNKMSEDQHKQIARDLYKKYGYDAHSIGDLMQELVILKGKFESEKKRKPDTNTDKWFEPGRDGGFDRDGVRR